MAQFVKYTDNLQDLVNRGNAALNRTDVTVDEGGGGGGRRTGGDVESDVNAVYQYDGMFCVRLVKHTEKETDEQTGEEVEVENTYVCVTDGLNVDPFDDNFNSKYAGVVYVNHNLFSCKCNKMRLPSAEESEEGEDEPTPPKDGTKNIIGVSIKVTLDHGAYTDYWNGEAVEHPAETGKVEIVFKERKAPDEEESGEGEDEGEDEGDGKVPSFEDDEELSIYGIDDRFHSYHLIGRIRETISNGDRQYSAIQDSWGCPKIELPFYIDN